MASSASEAQYPVPEGRGFPKIRWSIEPDGTYCAEWLVFLSADVGVLPLALLPRKDLTVEFSFPEESTMAVKIRSSMKPIRPEVFGFFYQLIGPAFEKGLILEIEGGDMELHSVFVRASLHAASSPA